MPPALDPTALIGGPYRPPRVRVGDRVSCLYRDGDVVITSISDSRIPWPRCQRPGQSGGSGLLVDETLVRAIKTESAAAMRHWFGVAESTIWLWRRAFGVTQWGTPGSKRLLEATTARANAACRGKPLSKKAIRDRRRRAKEMDLAKHLRAYNERRQADKRAWTKQELALLGTMPDTRLAPKVGRTRDEVRRERARRRIPRFRQNTSPKHHRRTSNGIDNV